MGAGIGGGGRHAKGLLGGQCARLPRMRSAMARLAFLLPNFAGGGAERVALTLIEVLVDRGHAVDLVLAEAKGELLPLVPSGVRVIDLRAPRLRRAILPLGRYLRRERPDALQVNMWPLTIVGILAGMLARTRTRVVVSDHVTLTRQYGGNRATMMALRASTRLFYPRAAARLCVSQGAADDLATISGIDRGSIEVIHNPVSVPNDIRSTPEIEMLWGEATARILTVGSLKLQKNHALLLRAFARFGREDARLMILGEGSVRRELEMLARELGIAGRIIMPGFAVDPWPYYASASLFVLSSDYEGFGNVLVEALASGVPVVSTDCESGPREILADGEFGTLVPCGDADALAEAMEQALGEAPDRAALRARAADFRPAQAVESYLRLMVGPDEGPSAS
jgi:glycosyltransferase involved in cell wall biosynthesis